MRVLLGSGGFGNEERRAFFRSEMRSFFGDDVKRILFIPYALHDHQAYLEALHKRGFDAGYELIGIDACADPVQAVEEAEAIFVGGGNTFRLTHDLQRFGLIEPIKRRVGQGMPYMGASAGTNVACPTMQTTNDMPIVMPQSFETLGLIPFQINSHYYHGQVWVREGDEFIEHFGETRAERIAEYHEMNSLKVLGLHEGTFLLREKDQYELLGGDASLFCAGCPEELLHPGSDLAAVLTA
ncbi:MAG: dipeptidase PepE [Planctomycetota bacterium]|jgi:dipeptidase E|nr:dipeptidase PepE [Planctomycetota bacterium]